MKFALKNTTYHFAFPQAFELPFNHGDDANGQKYTRHQIKQSWLSRFHKY